MHSEWLPCRGAKFYWFGVTRARIEAPSARRSKAFTPIQGTTETHPEAMAYVITRDNGRSIKEEFNPELIEFRPPKVLDHGGKIIGISYKGKPLHLQLPEMVCPYGTNVFEAPDGSAPPKYSLDFSFRGEEDDERIAQFHSQLERLEEVLVERAVENSMAWFKKRQSKEVIEAFFTPILKRSKDKETGEPDGRYPDTFKVKLNVRNDEFECKAFDTDNTLLDEPLDTLITKGTRATALVQPSFIWFAGGKFGMTTKAVQMRVKVPARIGGNTCVMVDDAEDMGEGYSETMNAMGNTGSAAAFVDDDEEDDVGGGAADGGADGDEDADEDAPAPTPAPAKRRPRRPRKADA